MTNPSGNSRFYLTILSALLIAATCVADDEVQESESPKGSWLVVPIVITEPAIGEGLGAGIVYFHAGKAEEQPRVTSAKKIGQTAKHSKPPPTATGLFGARTSNGTTAFGIGHSRSFSDDHYRATGVIADAQVKASYYIGDIPFEFNIDGGAVFASFKRRLGESNWLGGISTSIVDASVDFGSNTSEPDGPGIPNFSFSDVGFALTAAHDTRDDTMMPSDGHLYDLSAWTYSESIGGDFDYWTARMKANWFHHIGKNVVLGLRLEAGVAGGDVPFYAEPYVPLRGIPVLRYQGEWAGVAETEVRYQFANRWAVLAFAGRGFVDDVDSVTSGETIKAYGVGARWLAVKKQNVWIGIDFARGPDKDHWYLQMTHPW